MFLVNSKLFEKKIKILFYLFVILQNNSCKVSKIDPINIENYRIKSIASIGYTYSDYAMFYTDYFEYDKLGQVSSILRINSPSDSTRTKILRNKDNMISGVQIDAKFPQYNYNGFDKYEFNNEKKLVSVENSESILTCKYKGDELISSNILSKKSGLNSSREFTWVSNNLTKITEDKKTTNFNKYDKKTNPFYQIYFLDLGIRALYPTPEFLSKNNILALNDSSGEIYNYMYEYDGEGRVIKLIQGKNLEIIFTYY